MGLVLALGFLQNLVLARILGPEGLGHLAIVNRVMGFAALLATGGLTTSILRYAAAERQENAAWALYQRGLLLAGGLSLIITLAVVLLPATPAWVFDPIAGIWLPLAAIVLPLQSAAYCAIQYCQSRQRMRAKAVLQLVEKLTLVIAMVSGAWLDGFRGAVIAFVIGTTVSSVIAWAFTARFRALPSVPSPIPSGELLRFGAWSVFTNFQGVIVLSADVMCLSALVSDAATVGFYALAVTFQQIVRIPMGAYLDARFPEMVRVSHDVERLRTLRRRMRNHVLGIAAVAVVAVGVIAPWIIPPVFGEPFRASVLPLEILLAGHLFSSLGVAQGRSMLASGWVEGNFWAGLLAAVSNIALNLTLIPIFGIEGAAAATALTYLVWTVSVELMCRWHEGRRVRDRRAT